MQRLNPKIINFFKHHKTSESQKQHWINLVTNTAVWTHTYDK